MRQRRTAGSAVTLLVCVGVLLAGCQPGPPEPPPTSPSVTPRTSGSQSGTPTLSQGSVRFTAQGDIGLSTGARKVLDTVAGLKPQLNLALGDFSYKAGLEQEFCDMVTGKLGTGFPYQVVTGNHESDGRDGDIENIVRCLPNKLPGLQGTYGTQWYVDVPEKDPLVRFILVSPGIDFTDGPLDYSKDSDRWRWTSEALDGAKRGNIPWTVVGMHTTCLSVGRYDCQSGNEFTNMLMAKKADLVLTAHDHNYQRTHQLGLGAACPDLTPQTFLAGCRTDSDKTMVQGAGTVFATVGTGGVGLYDVDDNDSEIGYFAAWSGRNQDPSLGTLEVTATADTLSARFVPAEGYTFTDAFSIRRR